MPADNLSSLSVQKCTALRGLKRRPLDVATKTGPLVRVIVCPPRTMWPISGRIVFVGKWLGFTVKSQLQLSRKEVLYVPTRIVVRRSCGV